MNVTIIGDLFECASDNVGVFTESEFRRLVLSGQLGVPSRVRFGQGVSLASARTLSRAAVDELKLCPTKVLIPTYFGKKARKEIVHKRQDSNVIITAPEWNEKGFYSAWLYIDGVTELMSDHLTGRHLQGIVLLEAARQLSIAIGALNKPRTQPANEVSVVVSEWKCKFHQFVYPFECRIDTSILSSSAQRDRKSCKMVSAFYQEEGCVAEVESDILLGSRIEHSALDELMCKHVIALGNESSAAEAKYAEAADLSLITGESW